MDEATSLRLTIETLEHLGSLLQEDSGALDLHGVVRQYNQVREQCASYIDGNVMPPMVTAVSFDRQRTISQLLAHIDQLQGHMSTVERRRRESQQQSRKESEPAENPPSLPRRAWSFVNQNLPAAIIGGGIVALITSYIAYRVGSRGTESPKTTRGSSSAAAPSRTEPNPKIEPSGQVTSSPSQIVEAVEGLPPMQRSSAAAGYKGIRVRWSMLFDTAYREGSYADISLNESGDFLGTPVYCRVKLADYPEIKVMKEAARITVAGSISEVDHNGGSITLKDVTLDY